MKCAACGKNGLRSTQLATVLNSDDYAAPGRKRVCHDCADQGMLIVAVKRPIIQQVDAHKHSKDVLAPYIKQIEVLRKGAQIAKRHVDGLDASEEEIREQREFWTGKLEAFEQITDLLKRGLS